MQAYKNLLKDVLAHGEWSDNRTGIRTLSLPGQVLRHNVADGFPALTLKRLPFKSVVGELCALLRAKTSAADFRELGCKVWDQNANENEQWLANPFRKGTDDLGPVYGAQWRNWQAYKRITVPRKANQAAYEATDASEVIQGLRAKGWTPVGYSDAVQGKELYAQAIMYRNIDQLRDCLDTLVNNPTSRRILFHAWNPAVLDEVALPACHLLYQFLPNATTRKLSLVVYLRSNDLGLGTPYNLAEASALLALVSRLTGFVPHTVTMMTGDAHIYENHLDMVYEMLARENLPLPQLEINDRVPEFYRDGYHPEWLDLVEPSDFQLVGYQSHDQIKAPMAV